MSKLDDLFAEAEAAPADTSKAKLNALFSEAEAAPTPQSKLRALFGDEGQGQGTEGRPRLGGGGAGSTIPLPFGLAPVPNPLALLQQARGLPGFETGAQIADVVSAIPHIIGETIKSTGRALPEVPRETLRIAQAMAGGQTIPVDIIKAQAEDVMQAQQGNQGRPGPDQRPIPDPEHGHCPDRRSCWGRRPCSRPPNACCWVEDSERPRTWPWLAPKDVLRARWTSVQDSPSERFRPMVLRSRLRSPESLHRR